MLEFHLYSWSPRLWWLATSLSGGSWMLASVALTDRLNWEGSPYWAGRRASRLRSGPLSRSSAKTARSSW